MHHRLNEIDLLRGIAVVGMVFSGILPFNGALPAWMYHAQVPPPAHLFNPSLPGLTWVDLVFPFFLFAMGAVVPAVFPAAIEKDGLKHSFLNIFKRFILLLLLAVGSFNFAPLKNTGAGNLADLVGITAYIGLFLVFFRFPGWVPQRAFYLKISGIFLLSGLVYMKQVYWGGINIQHNDAILRVLANVYFVGTILWYVSRKSELFRIGLIFMVLSAYLGDIDKGYMQNIWRWQDPWHLVSPYLLKYLILFLLGTLAGDWLLKKEFIFDKPVFHSDHFILSLVLTTGVLSGLLVRQLPLTLMTGLLCLSFFFYRQKIKKVVLQGKNQLFYSGIFLLFCGLFMEPFQGGVKKDPSTLSYFFITAGIAFVWVYSFLNMKLSKLYVFFEPIQRLGQNALMAYFMAGFLIIPLFNLTGLSEIIQPFTFLILLRAVFVTLIVITLVSYFTKRGVFWKI